jgi:hypothetical protein
MTMPVQLLAIFSTVIGAIVGYLALGAYVLTLNEPTPAEAALCIGYGLLTGSSLGSPASHCLRCTRPDAILGDFMSELNKAPAQDAALRECPTCVRRFKPGEHCDLETCSLRQETSREAFEQAWRARPWLHDPESGKDRAWRWWSAGAAPRTPAGSEKPGFNAIKREEEICALEAEVSRLREEIASYAGQNTNLRNDLVLMGMARDQALSQVEGLTARLHDILEADQVLSSVGVTSGTFRRHMADPLIAARELLDRSPEHTSTVGQPE